MNSEQVKSLMNIALEASLKAGIEILNIYESDDFNIELKGDNSPLTKADKAAHQIIENLLIETKLPILSEEGKHLEYDQRKLWDYFWLVDPLDGTKEFIKRNGEFTVNIALIHNDTPVAGVVYVPVSDQAYINDGTGSYLINDANKFKEIEANERYQKLPLPVINDTYKIVGSRSHMSDETVSFIETIDSDGKPKEIVSKGSSLKICMVAEGNADIYPRLGPTMEWDTAAGHAIVLGAGKTITIYPDEQPLIYNKPNLLNPYFIVK